MLLGAEVAGHCCLLQHQERRAPQLNEGPLPLSLVGFRSVSIV